MGDSFRMWERVCSRVSDPHSFNPDLDPGYGSSLKSQYGPGFWIPDLDPGSGSRVLDPGLVKFIEKIIFSFL